MINEIHWGVQTVLEKRLLLNFQLGVGFVNSKYKEYYGFIPTIGLKLKYVIF
ncbi:MAG: hypothetical protein Q3983_07830 [Capnocytophaga sp.]|nr:hypothetical protein [Capnocytophaga sp.]